MLPLDPFNLAGILLPPGLQTTIHPLTDLLAARSSALPPCICTLQSIIRLRLETEPLPRILPTILFASHTDAGRRGQSAGGAIDEAGAANPGFWLTLFFAPVGKSRREHAALLARQNPMKS